jgi:serine/threonine protein kinase
MATENTCRKCGKPLAGGARHGFCTQCLFIQASADLVDPNLTAREGVEANGQKPEDSDQRSEGNGQQTRDPLPLTPRPLPLPPSFGDYDLLEEIGRGGMGVVYRARQRSLDRVVAIKMMAFGPGSSPELVKRFRVEAVAAASLHHPNIVAIHELGIHEDRHFFVMDYVEGQSLAKLISNQSRSIGTKQAAEYLQTVAEAVHYADERGILHRDLKPSNVLIDADDQPRVTDFGLATCSRCQPICRTSAPVVAPPSERTGSTLAR